MTIIETLLQRRVSRLAVCAEMTLALASLPVIAFLLARTGVEMPYPLMLTTALMVLAIRIYTRALRLEETRGRGHAGGPTLRKDRL